MTSFYLLIAFKLDNINTTITIAISSHKCIFRVFSEKMVLQPGQPAPDFAGTALINGEFKDIKNADYSGKYVVLFFYPADLYVPAI